MRRKPPADEEQAAVDALRKRGYKVKKPDNYVKMGLELDRAVFAEFTALRQQLGLKAYEALADAMSDWIKKHKP